jgi:hypothetical protein
MLGKLTIGGATNLTSRNSHIFKEIADFPVPGGPKNKIPFGELKTSLVNCCNCYPSTSRS